MQIYHECKNYEDLDQEKQQEFVVALGQFLADATSCAFDLAATYQLRRSDVMLRMADVLTALSEGLPLDHIDVERITIKASPGKEVDPLLLIAEMNPMKEANLCRAAEVLGMDRAELRFRLEGER
jgi:hypothetical protein